MTTARPQQRYDHRLRNLVQRTKDVTIATERGVPRSTARGWLGAAPTVVVCLDVADLTEPELRQEVAKLSRSDYEKEWGKDYTKPDFGTRFWSVILRYMPKIGPFKALAFNNPTSQTEEMYFKSINTTVDQYRIYLQQVRTASLELANCDFDSGKQTTAAEYSLTDETYAKLLDQLANRKFDLTSADLRDNILNFYSDLSLPLETKKDSTRWQSVLLSLDQLRLVTPAPTVAVTPAN